MASHFQDDDVLQKLQVQLHLQPAVQILVSMQDMSKRMSLDPSKTAGILDRCMRVVIAADEQLREEAITDVDDSIKHLLGVLHCLDDLFLQAAQMERLKMLIRKDEISERIQDGHRQLTEFLEHFKVSAVPELCDYNAEFKKACDDDAEVIRRLCKSSDLSIIEGLGLKSNQEEAMVAVQKHMRCIRAGTSERKLLERALTAIQRITKIQPTNPPPWTITSFDIDISEHDILGAGAFGVVKKGTWGNLEVAVKQMIQATNKKMLLKEVEIWSQLRHDHVVPFYGASLTAIEPLIVCRFMRNGNVVKYLTNVDPNANRVKLAHEIALGMLYIHNQGIVHGDLKGDNILIDDSCHACITDFGLSKIKQVAAATQYPGSETSSIQWRGTLPFMSPEAMDGIISREVDVYAYAMTLYQVFTNSIPFGGVASPARFIVMIATEHRRLERPTDPKVEHRGLTGNTWGLIWSASNPISTLRPSFGSICNTTKTLVRQWNEVIAGDGIVKEDVMAGNHVASGISSTERTKDYSICSNTYDPAEFSDTLTSRTTIQSLANLPGSVVPGLPDRPPSRASNPLHPISLSTAVSAASTPTNPVPVVTVQPQSILDDHKPRLQEVSVCSPSEVSGTPTSGTTLRSQAKATEGTTSDPVDRINVSTRGSARASSHGGIGASDQPPILDQTHDDPMEFANSVGKVTDLLYYLKEELPKTEIWKYRQQFSELYTTIGRACQAYGVAVGQALDRSEVGVMAARHAVDVIDQLLVSGNRSDEISCLVEHLVGTIGELIAAAQKMKDAFSAVRKNFLFSKEADNSLIEEISKYGDKKVSASRKLLAAMVPPISARAKAFSDSANEQRRRSAAKSSLKVLRHTADSLDHAISVVTKLIDSWSLLQTSVRHISSNNLQKSHAAILEKCRSRWIEIGKQYEICLAQAGSAPLPLTTWENL